MPGSECDLLDIELGERLSVACFSSVMLLAVHLEDGQLRPFQVFYNLGFHHCTFQIGLADIEFAILLDCQNSA